MGNDEWPNEPAEPDPERDIVDPEEQWGNPEEDLSSAPDAEARSKSLEAVDVDPELSRTFWAAVVFANLALAGLTIGPMVIFFRNDWTLGGVLMTAGAFSLFRVYQYYREFERQDFGEDDGSDGTGGSGEDDGSDEGGDSSEDDGSGGESRNA